MTKQEEQNKVAEFVKEFDARAAKDVRSVEPIKAHLAETLTNAASAVSAGFDRIGVPDKEWGVLLFTAGFTLGCEYQKWLASSLHLNAIKKQRSVQ
jgi:hypothetical protein